MRSAGNALTGQVVVPGPAEPAQVRAPAHDFHEQPRAEFGVGGEDHRRWRVGAGRRGQRGLAHRQGDAGPRRRLEGLDGAAFAVPHVHERRHVEPAFTGERSEQPVPVGCGADLAHERGHQHLALAGRHHVGERRERFGVDEGHRPADDDQRVAGAPLRGVERQPGQAQEADEVGVVPFERDREREHVEVPHRRAGLHGCQGTRALERRRQLAPPGQEHALAHDVVQAVEQPVDGLEAQVGHPDPIGVRERERDAQPAGVRLAHVADFTREERAMTDRGERSCPSVRAPSPGIRAAPTPALRNLALRRRRSRMPWMYALYHVPDVRPASPGA